MAVIPIALLLAALLRAGAAFRLPSAGPVASTTAHRRRMISSPPPRCTQTHPSITHHHHPSPRSSPLVLRGLFDDSTDASDAPSQIPPELRDEIYSAEANTPAAQGRQQRVVTYIIMTLAGVTTAFFNAFLSDLRFGDGAPSEDLAYYGFGWIQDNFLLSFLFTNKIGGALGLLGAGLSGTLAEVEVSLRPARGCLCIICNLQLPFIDP